MTRLGAAAILLVALRSTTGDLIPSVSPSGRRSLFWLVPYSNITSIQGYTEIWSQFATFSTPGYLVAGSAYALKHNGTLGYADTAAGEGLDGSIMEAFGFPALKQLMPTLPTLGMTYFTHEDGIAIVLKNPQPFVQACVETVQAQNLQGIDLDYEPQQVTRVIERMKKEGHTFRGDPFFDFLQLLGRSMEGRGWLLTVDATGGCSSVDCASYSSTTGLTQVNTMDTFNIQSLSDFQQAVASDNAALHGKWGPGFEPGNCGESLYKDSLAFAVNPAANGNVTGLATWAVHEWNVGAQPQWLFDTVNAFLAAPMLV